MDFSDQLENKTHTPSVTTRLTRRETLIATLIVGFLFFVIGFVSWMNSILIPYFKIACQLTNFQAYLVTFSFYISYFIMSFPASRLLKRTGFKNGIKTGFWFMAAGAFLFVPAALTRTYGTFLCGLFTIGTGMAIMQTAINPYITLLGPRERAAQRISIMGIFNKGAGISAPLIFAAFVLRPTDTALFQHLDSMTLQAKDIVLSELLHRVVVPYIVMGSALVILGLLVKYSAMPEVTEDSPTSQNNAGLPEKNSIVQFPHLILGAVAIFLHTGTQVIAIDSVIGYAGSMHISLPEGKVFPSYTLLATIAGYLVGIICIPRYLSQLSALRLFTLSGLLFTLLILFANGWITLLHHTADISLWFVVLLGFSNSLIWAGIWPLALADLGSFTKTGASILIMGLCGNAILPLVYGYLADRYNVRQAYWVLFPCYLYILFYSFHGYRLRHWSRNNKQAHGFI